MAAIMDHYLRQLQDASGSGSGSGEDAPQATSGVALIQTLLIIIVFLLMMGLGATVTVADFKQTLKTPKGPIAGLLSQFGVMPLVAYLFAKALGVSNATGLSMVLIGCTPGGSTSNLFSYFARGDVPLSITMTVISNGFALFMMPLLVELYKQDFTTDEIDVPVRDIILGMAIVLVPVSIGLTIKKFSDKWAWRVEKFGSVVGVMFIVLAMLYVSFDNQHIFDSDWEIWFAAIFVHFCASGCGYGLALVFGLPHRSARTVSLETGIQNTTLTIAIVTLAFPDEVGALEPPMAHALAQSPRSSLTDSHTSPLLTLAHCRTHTLSLSLTHTHTHTHTASTVTNVALSPVLLVLVDH